MGLGANNSTSYQSRPNRTLNANMNNNNAIFSFLGTCHPGVLRLQIQTHGEHGTKAASSGPGLPGCLCSTLSSVKFPAAPGRCKDVLGRARCKRGAFATRYTVGESCFHVLHVRASLCLAADTEKKKKSAARK